MKSGPGNQRIGRLAQVGNLVIKNGAIIHGMGQNNRTLPAKDNPPSFNCRTVCRQPAFAKLICHPPNQRIKHALPDFPRRIKIRIAWHIEHQTGKRATMADTPWCHGIKIIKKTDSRSLTAPLDLMLSRRGMNSPCMVSRAAWARSCFLGKR